MNKNILLNNIDKIHTTILGEERIRRNQLELDHMLKEAERIGSKSNGK